MKNVTTTSTTSTTVRVGGEKTDQTHLVVMTVIGAVMVALGLVLFCRYLLTRCREVSRRVRVPAFYTRFSSQAAKEDTETILDSEELEADTYHSEFRVEAFSLAASSDSSGATSPSLTPSPREEITASSSGSGVLERVRGGLGFTTGTGWQRF